MIYLILYIVSVLGLIQFKILWDLWAIKYQNRVINHKKSAMLDVVWYSTISTVLNLLNDGTHYTTISWILFGLSLRWSFFDLGFNLHHRGLSGWNYYGEHSKMDDFARKTLTLKTLKINVGLLSKVLLLLFTSSLVVLSHYLAHVL